MNYTQKAKELCSKCFDLKTDCPQELRKLCGTPFINPCGTPEREAEEAAYIEKFNEIAERN